MSAAARNTGTEAGIAEGAALFDAGQYWHAHEAWERVWLHERQQPGDGRRFVQGLIQVAAVWHHLARGRTSAAAALVQRAREHLSHHDPQRWPLGCAHLLAVLAALELKLRTRRPVAVPRLRLLRLLNG